MIAAIEGEKFAAKPLLEMQDRLRVEGQSATSAMRKFSTIVGFLDARNNEVFRLFIGPMLLWDLNCALALEAWRLRAHDCLRGWFDVIGDMEALSSLAAFAFDRPDHSCPDLVVAKGLRAKKLGHPLIGQEHRISNDVALEGPGHALIVTGSNMSGKSTLLRALGINTVLALAGAPVTAKEMQIGAVSLVTSMRVSDSLESGVSHFYAELQRLKLVVDMARRKDNEGRTTLYLLDEILHGTNSRERIIGARAIIRELLTCDAMGAISTHDLGISDLEGELVGSVRNVHFEEQVVGEKMTFDYRLREGVVQSSNALRLMKIVGIDVEVS